MLNLLVADDNIYYAKNLVNSIVTKHNEVKLIGIATDGQEVLQAMNEEEIDIIILDLDMPIYTGIDIIEKLENSEFPCLPLIIVISGEQKLLSQIVKHPIVTSYISKGTDFEKAVTKITTIIYEKIISNNDVELRDLVAKELSYIGFNLSHNGTTYLIESILLVLNSQNSELLDNLEKRVYPIVGKRHDKNTHNIKSNIIKATNSMYAECRLEKLKNYFSYTDDVKPTPKFVMSTVVNKINYQRKQIERESIDLLPSSSV